MGRNTHTQLMECQAALAREREATEAMREQRDFAREHEMHLMGEADSLRGRVRDLQEALERKARKYHAEVHGWRFTKFEYCDRPECVETREALVGLPERQKS